MGKWQVAPTKHVKRVWERIAPLSLADKSWDNVGIMIESPEPNLDHRQVLLTIDLTTAVCNEALSLPHCAVVIAYHPPIFRALKSLTMSDPLQASLLRLSARGISVFSPHTSLDATPNGINTWLIQPFMSRSSSSSVIVSSGSGSGSEDAGFGRIVKLKECLSTTEIVKMVKEHLGLEYVQLCTPDDKRPIESIAVCAGSGGSIFKGVTADLLITGEMSHHEVLAFRAQGTSVILTNHTNTERPYLDKVLKSWLQKELNEVDADEHGGNWEVVVSKTDADPLQTV